MAISKSKKTLEQLARALDIDTKEVSKAASRVLGLPSGSARDPQYQLTPYECQQIGKSLGLPPSTKQEGLSEEDVPDEDKPNTEPAVQLLPDPPAEWRDLKFGRLNHGLWLHDDVRDSLSEMVHLRKRLGIVLQHLGAHGRTTVVKGCRDRVNQGWLRSPLGGNRGMQYYLWWAPQGSRSLGSLSLKDREILIRTVRHHDDHAPLEAGDLGDCWSLTPKEFEDDELVGKPWTAKQLSFVESGDPVRLVVGRPGSGKTTALWKAVEARSHQRVLYLTWSRELTRYAREHFDAFAPRDARVEARDFTTFLSEICHVDVKRQPLAESHGTFREAISFLGASQLGPWAGREKALFAEIRAFLMGRAIPEEDDCVSAEGTVRLTDAAYLSRRGGKNGVGKAAAESLLRIVRTIEEDGFFARVCPELAAAAQAIERLRGDELPEGFTEFDRVVVDEAQDLTLLETSVITEMCRAVARHRGHAPWLLVAGDDGQTVRPSGFDWGPLSDLLCRRIAPPHDSLWMRTSVVLTESRGLSCAHRSDIGTWRRGDARPNRGINPADSMSMRTSFTSR